MTHLGRRRLHRYAVRVPRQDVLVAAVAGGRQSFALGLTGCVRLTYPTSPCDVLAHVPVLRPTLDVPNEIAIISREIHCLDVSSRNEHSAYEPGLRTGLWSKHRINFGQEFVKWIPPWHSRIRRHHCGVLSWQGTSSMSLGFAQA
jgi:hypothetical protein